MKSFIYKTYMAAAMLLAALSFAACDDDNTSDLALDGGTTLRSLTISGYEAEIDNVAKTIFVEVAVGLDLASLTIDAIEADAGAVADVRPGDVINCDVPRAITVVNGDVFTRYTLTAKHDDVQVLTASLNNKYTGTIDNHARTLQFFVPVDEDVTAMALYFTLRDGATATPASGTVLDFSNPVTISTAYRTANIDYTVLVVQSDMSQDAKAFIGNADNVDGLSPEAKAAATWMLENVPNASYISLQSILAGSAKLSDYKMVWCHFDFTDWPGVMWDSRDLFNDYYIKGGNILATRDGARYINDVWRIAKDQQCPNDMHGGEVCETLSDDLGFSIAGHEDHPVFKGLQADGNGRVLLASKGCSNSGRTLQWLIDGSKYADMADWEAKVGATAIASRDPFDPAIVTVAEFLPAEILAGFTSGKVITIGTPGYEWHISNGRENAYRGNIVRLTSNSINYLCK